MELRSVKVARTVSHKAECLIWNESNKSIAFFSLRTFDILYVIVSEKKALSLKHFFFSILLSEDAGGDKL